MAYALDEKDFFQVICDQREGYHHHQNQDMEMAEEGEGEVE